jgi:hypothetical protein
MTFDVAFPYRYSSSSWPARTGVCEGLRAVLLWNGFSCLAHTILRLNAERNVTTTSYQRAVIFALLSGPITANPTD